MYKLREELGTAVEKEKWKTARNRAKSLIELIPQVLTQNRIDFGKPHFSGLYRVGTTYLRDAPEKSRESILQYNQELTAAKKRVEKMK
jgi:hypothetical protein